MIQFKKVAYVDDQKVYILRCKSFNAQGSLIQEFLCEECGATVRPNQTSCNECDSNFLGVVDN